MHKRGQVSVFAVIGIVLVILVALFFFVRNEYGFFISPTSFLSDKAKPIEDNLKTCVDQAIDLNLETFGKQGGDFNPSRYSFYESKAVRYYCLNIQNDDKCLNIMPTLEEMNADLNRKIEGAVNLCVDQNLVKDGLGYKISAGRVSTSILTSDTNLVVKAHYDVKILKGENSYSVKDVVLSYDAPLAELYAVAVNIVNSEARVGFFEQLVYMLNKKGQYLINLDKPYPDKIYKIQKKNSKFEFWLAIEGETQIKE